MTEPRALPTWAEDLRRRYLRGEATMFILCGNVYDSVIYQKKMMALTEFLSEVLLKESKDTIAIYNVATGVRFSKKPERLPGAEDLLVPSFKEKTFAALERLLI